MKGRKAVDSLANYSHSLSFAALVLSVSRNNLNSVHEPSVFLPSQEFGTPYHPLFMTVSHSAAFRRNLKTHRFQSAVTTLCDPSTNAP